MFDRWRNRGCKFLISGPGVYICNACVDVCNKVIAKERSVTT